MAINFMHCVFSGSSIELVNVYYLQSLEGLAIFALTDVKQLKETKEANLKTQNNFENPPNHYHNSVQQSKRLCSAAWYSVAVYPPLKSSIVDVGFNSMLIGVKQIGSK
jgi:predicted transcriptional regulator